MACFRRARARSSPASPAKSARFIADPGLRVALRFVRTTVFPVTEARSSRGLLRALKPRAAPSQLLRRVRGVCVGCLFFKDTEPSPLRDSFSVRQQGGLPGAPPRSPRPSIHRLPGGLPWTAQHYCPVVSGPNCFQALGSSPGLPQSPML